MTSKQKTPMKKPSAKQVIQQMLLICKSLNQKQYLAAADGNLSYRINDRDIIMTPTARNKAWIGAKDICSVTLANKTNYGQPSGERLLHLEVYKRAPKAKAVIHAHPPVAIAWSLAHPKLQGLPIEGLSEGILGCGSLPIVRFARPGTQDMGDAISGYLPQHRTMILARHGALAWGEDLEEALNGIERVEAIATILMHAKSMGEITSLSKDDLSYLRSLRQQLGERNL